MCAMWSTTSEGRYANLSYVAHIAIMTGKEREAVSLEGISTISDLISKLDEKYPGLSEIFMPSDDFFNVRTAITLRRLGQPSRGIIDPQEKVEDGDILTFW